MSLKHVAIIMDGNGRWATRRFRPRVWGHIRGANIVSDIVEEADSLGLNALTLYTFSTENWSRPHSEISTLFMLFKKFIHKEIKKILNKNIRLKIIGEIDSFPKDIQELILDVHEQTKNATGLKFNLAFGYGARNEIIRAANRFIEKRPNAKLTEELFAQELYDPSSGDVDLMIRTGGDCRISNFLLWQSAYAELYFTKTRWPDFSVQQFREICQNVEKRERRFGNISNHDNENDLDYSVQHAQRGKMNIKKAVSR